MAGRIYTTVAIRVDAQLEPIIFGPPASLVLLSQGEARPGIKQGQHWGRPPLPAFHAETRPTPSRRPNLRLSNPVPR